MSARCVARSLFAAAGALLFVASLAGERAFALDLAWAPCPAPRSPSARNAHGVALDEARGEIVLFGGLDDSNVFLGDTWIFDGSAWRRVTPPSSPSARAGHAMAYDPVRRRVVLFGGSSLLSGEASLDDTWEWDGVDWRLAAPPDSAKAVAGAMMAFDSATQTILLFGGRGTGGFVVATTTAWNGTEWREIAPHVSPPARSHAGMALDPFRSRVLLHGGQGDSGFFDDTWEWDGASWTRFFPVDSPGPRIAPSLAHDPELGRVRLFGGAVDSEDVFEWDGANWSVAAACSGPQPRLDARLVALPGGSGQMLFGGLESATFDSLGDTWLLLPSFAYGSVNSAFGSAVPVLFVNGSVGGPCGEPVTVDVGEPLHVALDVSLSGPDPARYALWVWTRPPSGAYPLAVGASTLGVLVNPTPFHPLSSPQPVKCLRGGMPAVFAAGMADVRGPATAPWLLSRPAGFPAPVVLTLQGVIDDFGASNPHFVSVTNPIVLEVQ